MKKSKVFILFFPRISCSSCSLPTPSIFLQYCLQLPLWCVCIACSQVKISLANPTSTNDKVQSLSEVFTCPPNWDNHHTPQEARRALYPSIHWQLHWLWAEALLPTRAQCPSPPKYPGWASKENDRVQSEQKVHCDVTTTEGLAGKNLDFDAHILGFQLSSPTATARALDPQSL